MRLPEAQLADDVLLRTACLAARGQARDLLKLEDVIGLRDADLLRFQSAYDIGDRPAGRGAEVDQCPARKVYVLGSEAGEAKFAGCILEPLG